MTEYVTYEGVELMSVGMKWKAKAGELTFTFEHLSDAVEAANDDPHIRVPRLRLGHVDERFQTEEGQHDPFYDFGEGEPAFGQIANLRMDGPTLVGDFINVPDWLAEAMPSAYPSRSTEGSYIDGQWDVTTPGGKHYSFVLTDCALLGIRMPAISDLEDLQAALKGEGVEVVQGQGEPDASIGDVPKPSASADADKVVKRFWDEIAVDERYWWWPRAIWADSGFVIADDDDGSLWRVDYSTNDTGEVTFSDPVEVRETFVDVAGAPAAVLQKSEVKGKPKVFASAPKARATAPDNRAKNPVSGQPPADSTVGSVKEIAKKLGLAEDASEEDVLAKIDEINGGGEGDPPAGPPAGDPPAADPEADPAEGGDPDPAPEPPTGPEGGDSEPEATTVKVDRGGLDQLKADAAAGREARDEQKRTSREALLTAAVDDGRIASASREAWEKKHIAAPEATEAELNELPKGMVPTEEVGGDLPPDSVGDADMDAIRASYGIKPPEKAAA